MKNALSPLGLALIAPGALSPGALSPARGSEDTHPGPECLAPSENHFADEVWAKVGSRACLKCHRTGGDAEDSDFVLLDPAREGSPSDSMDHNRAAFARMAAAREDGQSKLLLKVIGKLDHGGEDVLAPDSSRFRVLEEFVRRSGGEAPSTAPIAADEKTPFFEGVVMLDGRGLLRRLTLSLGARLPTPTEQASVASGGLGAVWARCSTN